MSPVQEFFANLGSIVVLSVKTFRELFRRPFELGLLSVQLFQGGVESWSITIITAVFTGMVLASQFAIELKPFGAALYTAKVVALGIVRELGPAFTALLVGGRVGAGFAAEIGSMAVTEQIDAIRALGADPIRKLVLPRVLAMVIALPLLTILADLVGCLAGNVITVMEVGVTFRFTIWQMADTIGPADVLHGLMKSAFFGYVIAIGGCWMGMRTYGGTEGVGRFTTRAVVGICVTILASDFLLTRLFLAIYE